VSLIPYMKVKMHVGMRTAYIDIKTALSESFVTSKCYFITIVKS